MIALFKTPRLTGKYLDRVLKTRWHTTGPMCQRLQEAVGEFLGVPSKKVVLASSATSAFQGLCYLLREVTNTAFPGIQITDATWPGLLQAAYLAGYVRSVDVPLISVRTCIGGDRSDDCGFQGTYLVEDRCHAWTPKDPAASFAFYSFYPTKLVPGVEGGAIVCANSEHAERLRSYLYCGLQPGAAGKGAHSVISGIKANMTDVTAALNLEALELAPIYMWALHHTHQKYMRLIRDTFLLPRAQCVQAYLLQIIVDASHIPGTMQRLTDCGVASAWNFRPAGLLTLPMWPQMPEKIMKEVLCKTIRSLR